MTNSLVEFWRKASLDVAPYVHPEDVDVLKKYRHGQYFNYPRLDVKSFEEPGEHQTDPGFLHLSLLPVPYVGNLEKADIFILMTNPGFQKTEYDVESEPKAQGVIRRNCHQHFHEGEPFFPFAREGWREHPGYDYWKKNMKVLGVRNLEFDVFMERIAIIQMVPYHSNNTSKLGKLPQLLPSSRIAAHYAQTQLYERAKRGEILLLAKRQIKNYGLDNLDESDSVYISRTSTEARCKYYSPNTRDGRMILNWIEKHPR